MERKKDFLWLVFFLIVFINGFEVGGYQASLLEIGKYYDLSTASKGIFASVELFATMLAPLVLGAWADRNSKINGLKILLLIQIIVSVVIIVTTGKTFFITGVFFLGLTTSALQFITIAALSDAYPVSSGKKIGFLTSMYALGAFLAPLCVAAYLQMGYTWRTLFILLMIASTVAVIGLFKARGERRETITKIKEEQINNSKMLLSGILLLCVVMCIYVGYENGFAFFIDTLFAEEFHSSLGKYALSIFWVVMIPSRVLVGYFQKYTKNILLTSIIVIPVITVLISKLSLDVVVLLLCIPLGFACGAIYPSVLNIAMPLAGSHKATATGIITTATGIGGVIFTTLTGIVGDRWGLRTAIIVLSAFFILSFLAINSLIFVKNK